MLLCYVFIEHYSCIKANTCNVLTHSFNTKIIEKNIPQITRRTIVGRRISPPLMVCMRTLLKWFKTALDLKLKPHFKNVWLFECFSEATNRLFFNIENFNNNKTILIWYQYQGSNSINNTRTYIKKQASIFVIELNNGFNRMGIIIPTIPRSLYQALRKKPVI